MMTLSLNHLSGRSCASWFTAVGLITCVNRATHEGHGGWNKGIVRRFHDRNSGQDGNRWLTDGDHVGIRPEVMQHLYDVIDIVIQVERTLRNGTFRASCQSVI